MRTASTYGEYGIIKYDKLWKVLEINDMLPNDLVNAGVHTAILYKLKRNECVSLETICFLCDLLHTTPNHIMEYVPKAQAAAELKAAKKNAPKVEYVSGEWIDKQNVSIKINGITFTRSVGSNKKDGQYVIVKGIKYFKKDIMK